MAPAPTPDDMRRAGAILLAVSVGRESTDATGFDPFWAPVADAPLLAWSVTAFERAPEIAESVLVVAPDRLSDAAALAAAQGWHRTQTISATAPHLRDLLRCALDALSPNIAWIVVHDAARPLVTSEMIAAGLSAVKAQSDTASLSVGALPAMPAPAMPAPAAPLSVAAASIPVNETLKRVQNGLVVETPARSQFALLQTPQMFSRAALLAALDRAPASLNVPDAAPLAIASGLRVALFPGSPTNIRVATPADLTLAEALLNPR